MAGVKGKKPPKCFSNLPPEEAEAIRKKGREASAKIRAERKTLKEELKALLSVADKNGVTENTKISIALIKKAVGGDVKAFEVIRDTIGEKPVDRQEVASIDLSWFKDNEETK